MSIKHKSEFIDTVTKQIRFPFDRKNIALELQDHLFELESYYIEMGQTRDLAKTSAILEMGDPKEIGKALNQVHKPFWGWLWFTSKIMCILLLGITSWMSLQKVWDASVGSRDLIGLTNPFDYYLQTLGDNPNEVQLIANYSCSEYRIYINQDIIQFDDIRLYSDGTLVILYQDIKPFNPFGIGSDDYPLQQLSTLILPDGTNLNFRQDWPDVQNVSHILVASNFPIDVDTFDLKFVGYSDQFQTVLRLGNRYEKK
jgi:hypothetical protein